MLSGAKASFNLPAPGQGYLSKVPPTHTHTMSNVSPGSVGCFVFYTMPHLYARSHMMKQGSFQTGSPSS